MLRKALCLVVVGTLVHMLVCAEPAQAKTKEEKRAEFAAKVKLGVAKLGVGEDTRVQVTLRNKARLAGYISEVREDGFLIADLSTGEATTVAYADVKKIKGHSLSTGAKVAIGVGIAVAVLLILAYVIVKLSSD